MRGTVLFLLGILLALALAAGVVLMVRVPAAPDGRAGLDAAMEEVEEPTEAFANALHDCSLAIVREDGPGREACFAPLVEADLFPTEPGVLAPGPRWLARHLWKQSHEVASRERQELLASLDGFLAHFRQVEDMRLKLKNSAREPGGEVRGDLKFWLVGRDADGRREWVHGTAKIAGRPAGEDGWEITALDLGEIDALMAERDLFSEVAGEAGLEAVDPPVLEHPTLGLAAYGAAAGDVDGDGLLDLLSTGQDGNALYLNRGDGTFQDVAAAAFIKTLPQPATAPLFLDMDNDGDLDLFLSAHGEQMLFENRRIPEGRLAFRDVSRAAGVARHAVGFSAVAGDVNRDGLPDIYVTSYNNYGPVLPDRWEAATNGLPNLLFINKGGGVFQEEAAAWGVDDARWSYAAAFADVDGDGLLDLYVANDFGGGNALYMNRGDRFEDEAAARGVQDNGYAMGVSFGDPDGDGDLDLHVTKMSSTAGRRILARLGNAELPSRDRLAELAAGNSLYQNLGDGLFRDISSEAGPFPAGWAWGGGFVDLDNDGLEDLHTPNGFLSGPSLKDT